MKAARAIAMASRTRVVLGFMILLFRFAGGPFSF
jgi:hypothetical protein